jgi:hypothetical protein
MTTTAEPFRQGVVQNWFAVELGALRPPGYFGECIYKVRLFSLAVVGAGDYNR